jgi:hypothetical protein
VRYFVRESNHVEVEFVVVESPANALATGGEMGRSGINMTLLDNKVKTRSERQTDDGRCEYGVLSLQSKGILKAGTGTGTGGGDYECPTSTRKVTRNVGKTEKYMSLRKNLLVPLLGV